VMHRTMCFFLRSDSVLTLKYTGTYTESKRHGAWLNGS
jgi:hypothetical protein